MFTQRYKGLLLFLVAMSLFASCADSTKRNNRVENKDKLNELELRIYDFINNSTVDVRYTSKPAARVIGKNRSPEYLKDVIIASDKLAPHVLGEKGEGPFHRADRLFEVALYMLASHQDPKADEILASLDDEIYFGAGPSLMYTNAIASRGERCISLVRDESMREQAREIIKTDIWDFDMRTYKEW